MGGRVFAVHRVGSLLSLLLFPGPDLPMWRPQGQLVGGGPYPSSPLSSPPRLRNDLYCVEWDVKPYYTIPPSVEDDVDVWRYAILQLHARNDDERTTINGNILKS